MYRLTINPMLGNRILLSTMDNKFIRNEVNLTQLIKDFAGISCRDHYNSSRFRLRPYYNMLTGLVYVLQVKQDEAIYKDAFIQDVLDCIY